MDATSLLKILIIHLLLLVYCPEVRRKLGTQIFPSKESSPRLHPPPHTLNLLILLQLLLCPRKKKNHSSHTHAHFPFLSLLGRQGGVRVLLPIPRHFFALSGHFYMLHLTQAYAGKKILYG